MNVALQAQALAIPRSPAAVYQRCLPLVWWTVRCAGVPDAAIEDVVHDVFVALLGARGHAPDDVPFERWVAGVARSVAFSHRRSHARRRARLQALPESSPAPASDELLARRRAWVELATFLETLDDDQREAFVLVELHGASAPEVARVLDVKLNTVYARVRLARGKLQRWLDGAGSRHELASFVREASLEGAPMPARGERAWLAIAATTGIGDTAMLATGGAAKALSAKAATWLGKLTLASSIGRLWIGATVIAGLFGVGVVAGTLADPPTDDPPVSRAPAVAARPSSVGASADHDAIPAVIVSPAPPPTIAAAPSVATSEPKSGLVATLPPPPRPSGLDDDIALLDRADAFLAAGRADDALALLERHTLDVPASPLAPERALLRVRALCAKGRTAEAVRLAASWRARADLPRVAETLERTCARG